MLKLNIAMFGHKRIPSREGGIEIVVEKLSVGMIQAGHTVTCFNRSGHHVSGAKYDAQSMDNYHGITLKSVPTLNKKGLAAITSSISAALAAGIGCYDVVHIHAEGPAAFCWLSKLLGKRIIVTIHGLDWAREKWENSVLGRIYIKMGERIAVRCADEIIVLSKDVQQYFWRKYGRETVFIPNGVDLPVRRRAELISEQFGLEAREYILFLGRIVPEKGLRYLIEAFREVQTQKKLVIAGGSSDTDEFVKELECMARMDQRIIFTGFVQGAVLEELYSNAYLYVLPSDLEGMPLSLLEAMSYGNCCLVSDIPECKDVVEDRAIAFRHGNVFDLTQKLQMLCDSPEVVSSYRVGAADYICNKYRWPDIVRQTLALYNGDQREHEHSACK